MVHMAGRALAAVTAVTVALSMTTCGDDGDDEDRTAVSTDGTGAGQSKLGESFPFNELTMTIDSISVVDETGSPALPFLVVHVQVDNPASENSPVPYLSLICSGVEPVYNTRLEFDLVPAASTSAGFASLKNPVDADTAGAPECAAPAYLQVGSGEQQTHIALDEAVLEALNDHGCSDDGGAEFEHPIVDDPTVLCETFGSGPSPASTP